MTKELKSNAEIILYEHKHMRLWKACEWKKEKKKKEKKLHQVKTGFYSVLNRNMFHMWIAQ